MAGVQVAGALLGLLYFRGVEGTSSGTVRVVILVAFVAFLVALAVGGVLLLRGHRWGVTLSVVLQAIQIPHLTASVLTYSLYGPLALSLVFQRDWGIRFDAELNTRLAFALGRVPEVPSFGVNLFAAGMLYLLLRVPRAKGVPIAGGVVVR